MEATPDVATVEHLNALRNHLLALGKADGQIQALREKSTDLGGTKQQQDISVIDILQVFFTV